ncbi:MAG: tetratricopeptide repeat protein [Actinobacteria bacterium]|nr:MAG: tetratricopeptide repeat protein [Actinomycetota bacterium]
MALGAPKQRAVLVVLLSHPNQTVSRERLIDDVWGEQAPRSAVQSLQVYVHGLRDAIGRERLETRGTGYRLTVEADELDAARFEKLVARARRSLGDGRPGEASDALDSALRLWRGTPLADLAGEPVAAREAERLGAFRLDALELRVDANLALGRHEELLPELDALVAEEPFRERFREQQVLALYRAGRQKDALDAYRAARETLVDELGVEPGPQLQALERQVLRQDPELSGPMRAAAGELRLPTPPTRLIGRRIEVAGVSALLGRDDVRLVTLTGPGGTGKTRLALAVAEELGATLVDGGVFVDLAALRDPSLVAPAIADALGVEHGEDVEQALRNYLADRRLLLVLDNFEQLLPGAPVVARLLAATERLLVLTTSRSPLRVSGEQEYPVPPLPVPARAEASFEEATENEAVRLFVARAQAVDPSFVVDEPAAAAIVEICRRLDGLPLAIELAAARVKLLPPVQLARRLERALDVLTAGPRDAPTRQRTLRATLDWSHELLEPDERIVFARLSVFVGGCTLDAAEAVCGDGISDVLTAVSSLVDDNLLRRIGTPELPRFAMLETVRDYAAEQLTASGEAEATRRRHAGYVAAVVREAETALMAGDAAETRFYDRLAVEEDNLRAALAWAAETAEVELEVELVSAANYYWLVRGHLREARTHTEDLVARSPTAPAAVRGRALDCAAGFSYRVGDLETARAWWEEALELFRGVGDDDGVNRAVGSLGNVAVGEGDLDRAVALYDEAATGARALGKTMRLATILSNLGAIANRRGDVDTAIAYFSESIELARVTGDDDGLAVSVHNLARSYLILGRLDDARAGLAESFGIARRLGYREVIAYCVGGFAEIAMREERPDQAAELLGASQRLFRDIGAAIDSDETSTQEKVRDYAVAELGGDRYAEAHTAGAALSLEDVAARVGVVPLGN